MIPMLIPSLNVVLKKCVLTGFLFLWVLISHANNHQEKKVKLDIDQVTIFLQGAQVSGHLKGDLEPGLQKWIVSGLPSNISMQSIQVGGKGDFTLLDIKYRIQQFGGIKKEIHSKEDSLEKMMLIKDSLQIANEIFVKEEALIDANKLVSGANVGVKAIEVEDMADLYQERILGLRVKGLKNQKRIEKLQKEIERLQFFIQEENQKSEQGKGELVLTIMAQIAQTVKLDLQYYASQAGWEPQYDLRAKDANNAVQLVYKAQVWQQTGQVWDQVKIKLSTANPAQGAVAPVLNPWYVQIYQPRPVYDRKVMSAAPMAKRSMDMKEEGAAPVQAMRTAADLTTVQENVMAVEYNVGIPYTIIPNGQTQVIEVKTVFLPASFSHFAIPKIDLDVFLLAKLNDWEKLQLLPGNAAIFYEGNFVGETFLNPKETSDSLAVSLGRDKRVVLERSIVKDFTSKKILGSNKKEEFGYEISVKNTHKENIRLVIEDQVPISQDAQIEVETTEISGAILNKETGKVTWDLNLKATEAKKLRFQYWVKYPKEKRVQGL